MPRFKRPVYWHILTEYRHASKRWPHRLCASYGVRTHFVPLIAAPTQSDHAHAAQSLFDKVGMHGTFKFMSPIKRTGGTRYIWPLTENLNDE